MCSRKLLIFGLIMLITLFPTYSTNPNSISVKPLIEIQLTQEHSQEFTESDPIYIWSDDDFLTNGFSGSGTIDDPYTLESKEIFSDYSAILIQDTYAHFVIRNCILGANGPYSVPVRIIDAANGRIENCTIISGDCGAVLSYSKSIEFINNKVHAKSYGLMIRNSKDSLVSKNSFYNCGIDIYGEKIEYWTNEIYDNDINGRPIRIIKDKVNVTVGSEDFGQLILINCTNVISEDISIVNNSTGLVMGFCSNITINRTTFTNNYRDLSFIACQDIAITNSIMTNITDGINADYCTNLVLDNVTAIYSSSDHRVYLYLYDCQNITMTNCILNFTGNGVIISSSDNMLISNCIFIGINNAITLQQGETIIASNNTFVDAYYVCALYSSSNFRFSNNTVENCRYAFAQIFDCTDIYVSDNTIATYGLFYWGFSRNSSFRRNHITITGSGESDLSMLSDSFIENNTIIAINPSSVVIQNCDNLKVSNNKFINAGIVISGEYQIGSITFSGNTVNSLPMIVVINQNGLTFQDSQIGQLIIINSNNIDVKNCTFTNSAVGVQFLNSTDILVSDSTFLNLRKAGVLVQGFDINVENCYFENATVSGRLSTNLRISNCYFVNAAAEFDSCQLVQISLSTFINHRMEWQKSNNITFAKWKMIGEQTSLRFVWCNDIYLSYVQIVQGEGIEFSSCSLVALVDCDLEISYLHFWDNLNEGLPLTVSNVTINGKELGYFVEINNGRLFCDNYGLIILIRCSNISISASSGEPILGIMLYRSLNCTINEVTLESEKVSTVQIIESEDCIVQNIRLIGGGIEILASSGTLIKNGTFDSVEKSFKIVDSSAVTIQNISVNNSGGILESHESNNLVVNGSRWYNTTYSLFIHGGKNSSFNGCNFTYVNNSLLFIELHELTLSFIDVINNSDDGIVLTSVSNFTLSNSRVISANGYGIVLMNCNIGNITKNRVYFCENYGIYMGFANNITVKNNAIGWNNLGNAKTDKTSAIWDSNCWSDYDGGGVYIIDEKDDQIDYSPRILAQPDYEPPKIDHPQDVIISAGDASNIVWHPRDENPFRYEIFLDGQIIENSEWDGQNIEFTISITSLGEHILVIRVYDVLDDFTEDIVLVIVNNNNEQLYLMFWSGIIVVEVVIWIYLFHQRGRILERRQPPDSV